MTNAQDYEVKSLPFNSPEADFSAIFHGNDIIFCSNRSKMNLSFDDDSLTMYYTDLFVSKAKYDGTFGAPEPLKGVNTLFNEGHATITKDGKRMYYTANLKRSVNNKLEKTTDYKLGIFIADYENGQWVGKGEFQHNASNAKYSVAHPALSENDSVLYFSSNMAGGKGKSDIYKCIWENGNWSQPVNVGDKVNTKGNEFFPFISEFSVLYFSTDSRNDSEGMDIYYSMTDEEGEFEKPLRLNNTINSPYDDFAYQEKSGVNQGTFSSNRNNDQDDIYLFSKYFNTSQDCHENYTANFCYHFMDETLANIDSLPIKYEWNLGDGTVLYGDSVDYCFKDYGKFPVTLSAIDTVTKMVFKKISETEITIRRQDKPFILSHDTVFAKVPFEAKVEFFAFDEFTITEIYWELSDGSKYSGETFMHTFDSPGQHQVKCGVAGKQNKNGIVPMVFVCKNIEVKIPEVEAKQEPLLCCDIRQYQKISLRPALLTANIESKQLKKFYKIIIAESKLPLKTEDLLLSKIDAEIIEIKTDSSYQYAIEQADNWQELLPIYNLLKEAGYQEMYAEEFTQVELEPSITKIIPRNPSNPIKLNSCKDEMLKIAAMVKGPSSKSTNEAGQQELLSTGLVGNDSYSTEYPDAITTAEVMQYKTEDNVNIVKNTNVHLHDSGALSNTNLKDAQLKGIETSGSSKANTQGIEVSNNSNIPYENRPSVERMLYKIDLFKSKERIPFNDARFSTIDVPITETETGQNFNYSIMEVPQGADLSQLLKEVKANGFTEASIESFNPDAIDNKIIRKGRHIERGNAKRLNVEFSKLADIKFEYNSSEICKDSFKNLNYIAAMLMLEEDFTLKVSSHTCAIGGKDFNQKLSECRAQAVVDYFISKGIRKERLIATGFGMSNPKQSNESEMGRAANRRVEFVVVFNPDQE